MQQFLSILTFYKPFIVWSFIINIVMAVLNPFIIPAITTKLFLIIFVWYLINETNARRKLIFYKNLGISPIKLFSTLFFIDIFITVSFLVLIKEFI